MSILDFVPPTESEPSVSTARRQGVMLCYPMEEKRLAKWNPPFFVQPKLDGERCRDISEEFFGNHRPLLVSSELTPIISLPHITEALVELNSALRRSLSSWSSKYRLDGELYRHGWKFEQIHSCVSRTVNPHPNAHEIKLFVFDIWNLAQPQHLRTAELLKLRKFFPPELVLVPTKLCYSLDEILRAYDQYIDEGFEGIIIRHCDNMYVPRRSTFVMKFKPKENDSYAIKDILEAYSLEGFPKNMVGTFVCVDSDGTTFPISPGTGCSEDLKRGWWKDREEILAVGKKLHVEYQNLTLDRGVPRFGRFPLKANKWLEVV